MISNSIRNYIKNNIEDCTSRFDLAYTIYILLGRKLYYSPSFAKMKDSSTIPTVSEITLDNPYVNCYTWSCLYNELLQEYHIESSIEGKFHKLVQFIADDIKVKADATLYMPDDIYDVSSDLTNIKFGLDVLYYRPVYIEDRDIFMRRIDESNKRLRINKGLDNHMLERIKLSKDKQPEEIIRFGIDFYNELYKKDQGEVERRQIFERYNGLLFKELEKDIIEFYDTGVMSKHLLEFINGTFYIENNTGFRQTSLDEIKELIDRDQIVLKYDYEKEKIKKRLK